MELDKKRIINKKNKKNKNNKKNKELSFTQQIPKNNIAFIKNNIKTETNKQKIIDQYKTYYSSKLLTHRTEILLETIQTNFGIHILNNNMKINTIINTKYGIHDDDIIDYNPIHIKLKDMILYTVILNTVNRIKTTYNELSSNIKCIAHLCNC